MTMKQQSSQRITIKLPMIETRPSYQNNHTVIENKKILELDSLDQNQDDIQQVNRLNEWSMNKPTKKSKKVFNSHNISFLYKNSSSIKKNQIKQLGSKPQFIQIQMFIAKIDHQLHKIGEVNYPSIFKNMEYCSGVYSNSFNSILKTVSKYDIMVREYIQEEEGEIEKEREEHIKRVNEIQEKNNQNYKYQINEVRERLEMKEAELRPVKKLLRSLAASRVKVLKYSLALGYDIREEGLVWIIKQLGQIPKIDQFPKFLTQKQINFIISKFTNEYQVSHCQTKMKNDIFGTTINQAYQFVNRKKRRELSLIKQNQALDRFYVDKAKDYSPDKHSYLYDRTLDIAQKIEKRKPRPTRYEIIYKQAARKLNKICKEKIHPQIYAKAKNKQNKNPQKQDKADKDLKSYKSLKKTKEKRRSTLIVEELAKMLEMSLDQTKKIEELYTKQQKELDQILRQIRLQKYTPGHSKLKINQNKFQSNQQFQIRNPISVIGCLIGWKKAQKIIQQQMFRF